MIVYLSCDAQNDFFVKIVSELIDELNRSTDNVFELIYPSGNKGRDTGTVRGNVLQIQQAELVIFDMTPNTDNGESYNAGVMIEYGIVLDLETPLIGYPWGGNSPKPSYKVFCNSKFKRSKMTPIVNESSILPYKDDGEGEKNLRIEIRKLLTDKLKEKSNYRAPVGIPSLTEGKFQPI